MSNSTMVAPPHSVVLITDPSWGDIPASMDGSLVSATDSCIAVGCLPEIDGKTEFILGSCVDVTPGSKPYFEGKLKTPSYKVSIKSVFGATLLEASVNMQETNVSIWVNDLNEPDRVVVGF